MSTSNLYTTKTASLKATKADIKNINVKNMTLGGKTIPEIIDENMIKVQTSTTNLTGLTTVTKDGIVTLADGKMNLVLKETYNEPSPVGHLVMIKDGEGFDENGNKVMNIDTDKIKSLYWDSYGRDGGTAGTDFSCFTSMEEWYGDMSSLETIGQMTHSGLMQPSETYDICWFGQNLHTFIGDLSSLKVAHHFFADTNLETFIGDLSSLEIGGSIITEDGMFSSTCGMFAKTNLSIESLEFIVDNIRDFNTNPIQSTFGYDDSIINVSNKQVIEISWRNGISDWSDEKKVKVLVILQTLVDKGWTVVTNFELSDWGAKQASDWHAEITDQNLLRQIRKVRFNALQSGSFLGGNGILTKWCTYDGQ